MYQKVSVLFLILGLGLTCPAGAITLDVKTKVLEKVDLAACKTGLVVFLERAGITVKETGEDYAVWISQIQRTQKGNVIKAKIELHLTKPSLVSEAPSLARVTVEFEYSSDPGFLTGYTRSTGEKLEPQLIDRIKLGVAAKTELALTEGVIGGDALAQAVLALLKKQGYQVQS